MRIQTACTAALLAALFLISGCPEPRIDVEKPVVDEVAWQQEGLGKRWDLPLKLDAGETVTGLKLDGPVLLARTSHRRVFVINAEIGRFLCYIKLGREGETIYGVSRHLNRIYVVGLDGFREYDLASGLLLRKVQLPFAASTHAVRSQGEIYIGSLDGKLYAMLNDPGKGLPRVWHHRLASGITSGPVIVRGLVAVGSANGEVFALRSRSTVVWKYRCNGRISCDLVTDAGKVFIASEDTKVYCLSTTGRLLWQRFLESPLRESPVPVSRTGMLYQFAPGKGMYALQIEQQGDPAWEAPRADLRQFVAATPLRAYFVSTAGRLEAVDPKTGETAVTMRVERPGLFATNREDSSIFFCTNDGRVLAMRDKNGTYIDRNKLLSASAP